MENLKKKIIIKRFKWLRKYKINNITNSNVKIKLKIKISNRIILKQRKIRIIWLDNRITNYNFNIYHKIIMLIIPKCQLENLILLEFKHIQEMYLRI